MDLATSALQYVRYLGGTQEDTGLVTICDTDSSVYTLGQGYSVELTAGTLDLFIIKQNSDGSLGYMYSFGGTNPDYAADMKLWINQLYITGYSQSIVLTNGFLDIFVMSVSKSNPSTAAFVKYIGTAQFSELSSSISVLTDGSFFVMGQISAISYSNGNSDIFMSYSLLDGTTKWVEYMGSAFVETPGMIVYNKAASEAHAFIQTNSVSYGNKGGSDWMLFALDKFGRNQCTALGINNITTALLYKDSTARPISKTALVTLKTVAAPLSSSITNTGVIQSMAIAKSSFCQKFGCVPNEEGIADTT